MRTTPDLITAKFIEPLVSRFPGAKATLTDNNADYIVVVRHPGAGTAEVTVQISKNRTFMDILVGECFQLIDLETDFERLVEIVVCICEGKIQGSVTRHRGKVVGRDTKLELHDGICLYSKSTDMVSLLLPGKVEEVVGFQPY